MAKTGEKCDECSSYQPQKRRVRGLKCDGCGKRWAPEDPGQYVSAVGSWVSPGLLAIREPVACAEDEDAL